MNSTLEIVRPIKAIRKHDFVRAISKALGCEGYCLLSSLSHANTDDLKLVLDLIATVIGEDIKVTSGVRIEPVLYVAMPRKRNEQKEHSGTVLLRLRLFCQKAQITIHKGELDTLVFCDPNELNKIVDFLMSRVIFLEKNKYSSSQSRELATKNKNEMVSGLGMSFKLLFMVLIILGFIMSK
uniref:Uncharacterized protein n=1 Tax=Vibrio genomosp. F6 TaxID=723172 RepID=A0A0H3ZQ04_9VIBR|nr:hypothetical protein [Vibrio genomosp. F6]